MERVAYIRSQLSLIHIFRHQGIGSYMFSQLISIAQACEAQLLELSSKDTSTQAVSYTHLDVYKRQLFV